MFCGECGAQNPDTNQFCRNCGKPLLRRQPAGQPASSPGTVPAPQPAVSPAPAASYPQPVGTAGVPVQGTAPKRPGNLLGIASLILGILSLGILPVILAIAALLLGIISLLQFRKTSGRIGITSVIGIVLGLATVLIIALF